MKQLLVLVAGAVVATSLAAQSEAKISIGVRSQLDRQKDTSNGKRWDGIRLKKLPDAPEHSKVYGILALQRVKDVQGRLVSPVDETALKEELIRQMDSHGFTHAGPKRRPEILLTVVYGRSFLPNPYYNNKIDVDNMGPELIDAAKLSLELYPDPSKGGAAIHVDDVKVANRLREIGATDKATRSMLEKLFIMVRAWKNPADPNEKPSILWVATMLVDDPDHQDLNRIAKQMLEAGAPFFDKEIKYEGVEILKPVPEGHVKVGTPEVVEAPERK